MANSNTAASTLAQWATPMPDMGPAIYRITEGPREHKHTYHIVCPWSRDGELLLLARYDREKPEAEVCVLETATGETRTVGVSRDWESHNTAWQQWEGNSDRILYRAAKGKRVSVRSDGSDEREVSTEGLASGTCYCSPDGRWLYGGTRWDILFPDDQIAPRADKGLWRINLDTGERELVLSVEQALAVHRRRKEIESCHMWVKMVIHHQRLPRILFNFTNTFWDRDGTEPRIRDIMTVDADGSNPAHLGTMAHHPNWHPTEDRVIANVKDCNDKMRFGFYQGDGKRLVDYVPVTPGAGHPAMSPDGKWISTGTSGEGLKSRLILCDPATGRELTIAHYRGYSDAYASFKAIDERAPGETVLDALARSRSEGGKTWQTQDHPAWSRDGSALLFNANLGEGSQLYMVDIEKAVAEA